MPEVVTRSAANPEFPRVIEARALRGRAPIPFDVAPTPAEAAALAGLLGAQAVCKLRFHGRLVPVDRASWRLEGELGATVTQTCVVTLDPVVTRVDTPVRRVFTPEGPAGDEIDLDPESDDEIERLGDRIDLGLVATEALALALPAYPRRDDADLGAVAASGPPGAAPIAEAEVRPFSALAALRGKLGDDA